MKMWFIVTVKSCMQSSISQATYLLSRPATFEEKLQHNTASQLFIA